MNIKLAWLIAAVLPACTPLSEDPVLNQLGHQMNRASRYEADRYSPGDAWQRARPVGSDPLGFGGPFGSSSPLGGFGSSPFSGSSPAVGSW